MAVLMISMRPEFTSNKKTKEFLDALNAVCYEHGVVFEYEAEEA